MLLHPSLTDVYRRREEIVRSYVVKNPYGYGDDIADFTASDREAWALPYEDRFGNNALQIGRSGAALPGSPTEYEDPYTIGFVTTTLIEDRDGDIVVPMGCQLKNYERNPVWFFGHQQWEIPIGSAKNKAGTRLMVWPEENRIKAACRFDDSDSDAMYIHDKVKNGFLNATSMAFVPIEAYRREREEQQPSSYFSPYQRDIVDRAQSQNSPLTPPGWIFKQYDLTEISIVGVPSNAGAIRDSLDREKAYISPKLQKGLKNYAAVTKGQWNGWCPGGNCSVVEKALNKDDIRQMVDSRGIEVTIHLERDNWHQEWAIFENDRRIGEAPSQNAAWEQVRQLGYRPRPTKSYPSSQEKALADAMDSGGDPTGANRILETVHRATVERSNGEWVLKVGGAVQERHLTKESAESALEALKVRAKGWIEKEMVRRMESPSGEVQEIVIAPLTLERENKDNVGLPGVGYAMYHRRVGGNVYDTLGQQSLGGYHRSASAALDWLRRNGWKEAKSIKKSCCGNCKEKKPCCSKTVTKENGKPNFQVGDRVQSADNMGPVGTGTVYEVIRQSGGFRYGVDWDNGEDTTAIPERNIRRARPSKGLAEKSPKDSLDTIRNNVLQKLRQVGVSPSQVTVQGNSIRVKLHNPDGPDFDKAYDVLDGEYDYVTSSLGDLVIHLNRRSMETGKSVKKAATNIGDTRVEVNPPNELIYLDHKFDPQTRYCIYDQKTGTIDWEAGRKQPDWLTRQDILQLETWIRQQFQRRKMYTQADMEVPGSRPPHKNMFDGEEDAASKYRNNNEDIEHPAPAQKATNHPPLNNRYNVGDRVSLYDGPVVNGNRREIATGRVVVAEPGSIVFQVRWDTGEPAGRTTQEVINDNDIRRKSITKRPHVPGSHLDATDPNWHQYLTPVEPNPDSDPDVWILLYQNGLKFGDVKFGSREAAEAHAKWRGFKVRKSDNQLLYKVRNALRTTKSQFRINTQGTRVQIDLPPREILGTMDLLRKRHLDVVRKGRTRLEVTRKSNTFPNQEAAIQLALDGDWGRLKDLLMDAGLNDRQADNCVNELKTWGGQLQRPNVLRILRYFAGRIGKSMSSATGASGGYLVPPSVEEDEREK